MVVIYDFGERPIVFALTQMLVIYVIKLSIQIIVH